VAGRPAPGLWRDGDFLKLWTGQTISAFGSRITREGIPLAANLTLGAGPAEMGLLAAAGAAPVLLVGLLAGVWVDRLRRRPVLIIADVLRAALLGSIPAAAIFGSLRIEQLYLVTALVGVLTVFFEVADQSYLPTLVEREHVVEGNSKLGATDSLAEIGGPPLAGVLVQTITAPLAILFDALSFLVSAASVALIRKPEPAPTPHAERVGAWSEILVGLRVVFGDPVLRATVAAGASWSFFGGAYATLYNLFLLRELGVRPAEYGVLVAMGGVGALLGALGAGRLTRRVGLGRALIGVMVLSGLVALLTPLAGGTHTQVLLMLGASQLVGDFGGAIEGIAVTSLRQAVVPDRLLGRANASAGFLIGGVHPIGALLAGALAGAIGMRATLLIAVIGGLLRALWIVFSPVRDLRAPRILESA
jgi:MFS family permease